MARAGQGANTTITHRDYRTGVLFGVALAGAELEGLRDALEAPVFHLYLGRKSCPLSAPLSPLIVPADSPEAALARLQLPPWHAKAAATWLYDDAGSAALIETRHDSPRDRRLWHFAPRGVHARPVEIRPEESR